MGDYAELIFYGAVFVIGLILMVVRGKTDSQKEDESGDADTSLEVDVDYRRRRNMWEDREWTAYRFEPPFGIPDDLRIEKRRLWSRFGALVRRLLGAREVIDHRGLLNQPFIITARNVDRAARFLRRPGVERFLLELNSEFSYLTLEKGEIVVEASGYHQQPVIEQTKKSLRKQVGQIGRGAPMNRSVEGGPPPGVQGVPQEWFESNASERKTPVEERRTEPNLPGELPKSESTGPEEGAEREWW
ncbi:MAG: hypothetical protein ACOCV2_04720 [Persicimonas sp.]